MDASLLDLAKAFKILKDAESGLKGERFRITGLLGYLLELEREDETEQHASADEAFSGWLPAGKRQCDPMELPTRIFGVDLLPNSI